MTYRFKLHEPFASGVSRVALDQIEAAEKQLAVIDSDSAVHNVRRCLKRVRALLRLVRPGLTEATYRRETRAIASVGRQFASARDQAVMRQTLAKVEARFGPLPNGMAHRLGKLLAQPAPRARGQVPAAERRSALAALAKTKEFFARTGRADIRLEHASEGLERAYRRARRAFRACYEDPSDETFHAWRKAVQQHWRHMQLLSKAWPEVMDGRVREAKELSRLLGDDHDLAVLAAFAAKLPPAELPSSDREKLIRLCRSWQSELRGLAKPRGKRLFAEPAGDFASRLALYWSQAESLSRLDGAHARPEKAGPVKERRVKRARGALRQAASGGLRKRPSPPEGR